MATTGTLLPIATTRMAALVECLCDEVDPVCYCGPFFGGDTPFDYCGDCEDEGVCGQAWVRLVQVYPSGTFPVGDQTGNCATPLAYEWEVGVVRCAPTVHDDGSAPTRDENIAAATQQYVDMVAMRNAVACCFGSTDVTYILGAYTPTAVLGGCAGGVWQVFSR